MSCVSSNSIDPILPSSALACKICTLKTNYFKKFSVSALVLQLRFLGLQLMALI